MNTFEQRRQLAYYRAAFHDMPVAGPMDGVAYGEYLKSKGIGMIIGVVASVVTMGAALPLLAGTLAMQIAGGVMMAGGVMSGVGAVTGNKKLMKIGGILSLAGGVGGIAAGAMGTAGGVGSEALGNFAKEASTSIDSVLGTELGAKAAANAAVSDKAGLLAATESADAGIINRAMENAPAVAENTVTPTAAELGGAAPVEEFAAGGQSTPGADGAAMSKAPDATLKLAEEAGAKTASEAAGKVDISGAGADDTATVRIYEDTPTKTAGGVSDEAAKKAAAETAAKEKLFMGMDKTELFKTGAGLLEKGAAAAFGPDEEQKMEALTDRYKAETVKLTTENDILAYKRANAGKQVAMIAANDPQMEQKVSAAAAAGHPVAFIPSFGVGGITPTSGGAQMANPKAQQVAAQQVVPPPPAVRRPNAA